MKEAYRDGKDSSATASVRFERDVAAGHSKYLSWQKEKKRLRAAEHRKATLPQRAAERIKLEGEWLEELEESGERVTGHKGLTYAALAAKCQEEGEREELPTLHVRTWDKTKGMKHKSQASKTAARARYRLNKWNRDNAVKDETLDWEDEQIAEWREEWPLEDEGGEEEEPLEDSEPEPLEPIEYEPSEPEDLGSLNNIEPGSAGGRPHEKLEVVIDSGASASALPMGWCEHYPTRPLRTGERTTYRTANGGIVHASGRKSIFGETTAGKNVGLTFVEMEVHRPLASVSQMVKKGNMVVFGHPKKGSYVHDKATGLEHPLEERNGIYILPVWVKPNEGYYAIEPHKSCAAATDGDLHVTAQGETASASSGGAATSFHRLARWP